MQNQFIISVTVFLIIMYFTGIALEALAGVVSLADAEVDPAMVCMHSLLVKSSKHAEQLLITH